MEAYRQGISKEEFIKEIRYHQDMDNFISGKYWEYGKGCSVGCSLESVLKIKGLNTIDHSDHLLYEKYLGRPKWLARLEDRIFEGVSKERQKVWTLEISEAIEEGQDLDKIEVPFKIVVLNHSLKSLDNLKYDENKYKEAKKVVEQSRLAVRGVIRCLENGLDSSAAQSAARSAADSAARSAVYSAQSAASSADSAAWSVAWSAAWSADSAVWSAESAARSAESAAGSAARSSASSAESSGAESASYEYFADELLKLIKQDKVKKLEFLKD